MKAVKKSNSKTKTKKENLVLGKSETKAIKASDTKSIKPSETKKLGVSATRSKKIKHTYKVKDPENSLLLKLKDGDVVIEMFPEDASKRKQKRPTGKKKNAYIKNAFDNRTIYTSKSWKKFPGLKD